MESVRAIDVESNVVTSKKKIYMYIYRKKERLCVARTACKTDVPAHLIIDIKPYGENIARF